MGVLSLAKTRWATGSTTAMITTQASGFQLRVLLRMLGNLLHSTTRARLFSLKKPARRTQNSREKYLNFPTGIF